MSRTVILKDSLLFFENLPGKIRSKKPGKISFRSCGIKEYPDPSRFRKKMALRQKQALSVTKNGDKTSIVNRVGSPLLNLAEQGQGFPFRFSLMMVLIFSLFPPAIVFRDSDAKNRIFPAGKFHVEPRERLRRFFGKSDLTWRGGYSFPLKG